ncbi:MAG: SDR family oxidoreductase [Treponema sp.]|nr:SDR family oxidoreductase [Treponema sp.]
MSKRKALFIGGTGTISMAITKSLAKDFGDDWELYLLNRGNRSSELPVGIKEIHADINNEEEAKAALGDMTFDTVCDFIGFVVPQLERDYRLFKGKTKQFMYISSASAYQKPIGDFRITEGTPLANPYWEYSRNKIACEEFLMEKYRSEGFPITIIRPSHTYDVRNVPLGVHGDKGSWQVIKRMLDGKPVIIHGDGTSLWHMTFNEDFAKGFIGLMGNAHAIGESYQITNDESLTWNQIYQTIADVLGVELKAVHVSSEFLAAASHYDFTGGLIGDKANTVVFDNTKLKRAVPGMNMNIRFEQGVRKTLDYVLSHKECQKEDPEFDAWCDKVIAAMEEAKKKVLG